MWLNEWSDFWDEVGQPGYISSAYMSNGVPFSLVLVTSIKLPGL
jgi:hypothetical protein